MQVVLWVVFGASVGVAALVVHGKKQRGGGAVALSGLRPAGRVLQVRLPVGWQEEVGVDGSDADGDAAVVARVHEPTEEDGDPAGGVAGRQLAVLYEVRPPPLPTALEYLLHGPLAGTRQTVDGAGTAGAGESVTVAGVPGRLITSRRRGRATVYAAAGVDPATGLVVCVLLDDPAVRDDPADEDADRDLVRRVAAAIVPVTRP